MRRRRRDAVGWGPAFPAQSEAGLSVFIDTEATGEEWKRVCRVFPPNPELVLARKPPSCRVARVARTSLYCCCLWSTNLTVAASLLTPLSRRVALQNV